MRNIFIVDGFQRKGPYTPEEVAQLGITPETIIWTFALGKDTPASEVDELKHLFSANPQIDSANNLTPPQVDNQNNDKVDDNLQNDDDFQKVVEEEKRKFEEEQKRIKLEEQEKLKLIEKEKQEQILQKKIEAEQKRIELEAQKKKEAELIQQMQNDSGTPSPPSSSKKVLTPIVTNSPNKKEELNNLVDTIQNNNQNTKKNREYSSIGKKSNFNTFDKPKNYMAFAILSTLLCCLPLGVVSIVFASQVEKKYLSGDMEGAQAASKNAALFAIIAAVVGGLAFIAILASDS